MARENRDHHGLSGCGWAAKLAASRGPPRKAPIVPYQAVAGLAGLLLQHQGIVMVHFVGVPPGTADLLVKFVPPETPRRSGSAPTIAVALNLARRH